MSYIVSPKTIMTVYGSALKTGWSGWISGRGKYVPFICRGRIRGLSTLCFALRMEPSGSERMGDFPAFFPGPISFILITAGIADSSLRRVIPGEWARIVSSPLLRIIRGICSWVPGIMG
jgi:hypothetical protein